MDGLEFQHAKRALDYLLVKDNDNEDVANGQWRRVFAAQHPFLEIIHKIFKPTRKIMIQ